MLIANVYPWSWFMEEFLLFFLLMVKHELFPCPTTRGMSPPSSRSRPSGCPPRGQCAISLNQVWIRFISWILIWIRIRSHYQDPDQRPRSLYIYRRQNYKKTLDLMIFYVKEFASIRSGSGFICGRIWINTISTRNARHLLSVLIYLSCFSALVS